MESRRCSHHHRERKKETRIATLNYGGQGGYYKKAWYDWKYYKLILTSMSSSRRLFFSRPYTNVFFQWSLGTGLWGRHAFFADFVMTNMIKIMFQQFWKTTIKNMKLMVKRKFWGNSFKGFRNLNLLDLNLTIYSQD